MEKRKALVESLEAEVKRLKAQIAEQMQKQHQDESENSTSSEEVESRKGDESIDGDDDEPRIDLDSNLREDVQGKNDENKENEVIEEDSEIKLSDEIEQALGDDPTKLNVERVRLHSSVENRWIHWFKKGLSNSDKEDILQKYPNMDNFKVPKLNLEISAKLQDNSAKRDNHIMERQKLAGSVLTILGSLITDIMGETDGLDTFSTIAKINDAAKLTNQLIYEQTESRKAFLLPGIDKKYRNLLENIESDEFLFGKDLTEKIKTSKAIEKIGSNIRPQPTLKKPLPLQPRSSLNFRSLAVRRTGQPQSGNSNQSGCSQRRLYFKNKQQPFNPRVKNQPRFKPRNQERLK